MEFFSEESARAEIKKINELKKQKEIQLKELEQYRNNISHKLLHPIKLNKNQKEINVTKNEIKTFEREISRLQKEISSYLLKKCIKKCAPIIISFLALIAILIGVVSVKEIYTKANVAKSEISNVSDTITQISSDNENEPAFEPSLAAQNEVENEVPTVTQDAAESTTEEPSVTEKSNNKDDDKSDKHLEQSTTDIVKDYNSYSSPTEASSTPAATPKPKSSNIVAQIHGTNNSVSLSPGSTVWLSATGKKFHKRDNCGRMKPENAKSVTVEEAVNSGYDACEKCYR